MADTYLQEVAEGIADRLLTQYGPGTQEAIGTRL